MGGTKITSFNPDIHHRHSIRLKGYDYSQPGAYFVTISAYQRFPLFGDIKAQVMLLNHYGDTVRSCWEDIEKHYVHVELDSFVVMPNHVHGIIVIADVGAGLKPAPTKRHPLPEIVRAFKTFSARKINEIRDTTGIPVWQRNYYDHVIRGEREFNQTREYISNNVLKWALDVENPDKQKGRV